MRRLVRVFSCVVLLAAAAPAQRALAGSRPNILFVFSDDHACQAISAYGSTLLETPHIDRIAREGALFRRNFCGNALCGPSRATVLTGQHSHTNGFMRNGNVFDPARQTFVRLLRSVGYQTAVVGKWHLESEPQGFDYWEVLPGQGQYHNPDFLTEQGRVRHAGHATDVTTGLALEWLERRDPSRPFVLMCQHKAPHRNWLPAEPELGLFRNRDLPEPATLFDDFAGRAAPIRAQEMTIARHLFLHYDLMVPPTAQEAASLVGEDRSWPALRRRMSEAQRAAWDAAYEREDEAFRREDPQGKERVRWMYQRYVKNYLRCVAGVDRSVGELLAWLDAHPEVKANTLVVYASDQGFYLGEHGFYDKRWMFEESLRMPLTIAWPGWIEPGIEVDELTQNIDFAPTFLELAGVPVPDGVHGRSLVPLLEGRAVPWRDAVYYHYYESHAVHMVPAMYGVRSKRHKLVRYYEPEWDCVELFDLEADPQELLSVADDPAYAAVRRELEAELARLRAEYGDDTGVVAGAAFPVQAGIARVGLDDTHVTAWCNTIGGYLLAEPQPAPSAPRVRVATAIEPLAGARPNGGLVLSGEPGRRALLRVEVDFVDARLVVREVGRMGIVASAQVALPRGEACPLLVELDFLAHALVASVGETMLEVPLPEAWRQLVEVGYGSSNSECRYRRITIE
jgi:arylsulfatase A-like enzyme